MPVHPIPQPLLLDPNRVLDEGRDDMTADHKERAELAEDALKQTCAYAQQLWETLENVRQYLMDALPPDPREVGGLHQSVAAHPTGPDDEEGWQRWGAAYATATSVLCGPHGDSGFGVSEANEAMTRRREAPTVRLRVEHPELQHAPSGEAARPAPSVSPSASPGPSGLKVAGLAAVAVLALRGLLAGRPGR
jgi:hypothetical protein